MKKFFSILFVCVLVAASSVHAEDPNRTVWPSKYVHPDMPVYNAGKLNGWNFWNKSDENSLFILVDATNQSDLDKYVVRLKAAGFEQTGTDTFNKGLFNVKLHFNTDTILQISSDKIKVLAWPAALLKGIPEQKRGALTNIIEPSTDMPDYVQLYYIKLTQDDLEVWLKDLTQAGFEIDGDTAFKAHVTLQGRSYGSLTIQPGENGTNEWTVDFNYSN